jgi:hypothetical protein
VTTTSQPLGKWHLSLANVMVFVFALGLWFALVLSGTPELAMVALILIPAALISAISAWSQRRYAVILLACLFQVIVVGGSVLLVGNYMHKLAIHRHRGHVLRNIAEGLNLYYFDWNEYPPPPSDSKMCGSELARYLSMPGKKAPYLPYWNELEGQRSKSILSGGTGNALKWELLGKEAFILIDVGRDGAAGKYSVKNITPIPNDTNQDGIDDGADDAVITRTRGGYR